MRPQTTKTASLTLLAALATCTIASAQTSGLGSYNFSGSTPYGHYDQPNYANTSAVPSNFWSSTVHEGFFRGIASGIDATANLALALGQKAILDEQAYAMNRQNRVINTQTFIAQQQMKEEARRERIESKWLWLELMEERKQQKAQELAATTYRLPRSKFNSETGEIFWPELFQRPELASLCQELDGLFRGLADEGPQHDYLYREPIAEVCQNLLNVIRGQRATFGNDLAPYWDAVNLVSRLEYKAQHWSEQEEMGYSRGYNDQYAGL